MVRFKVNEQKWLNLDASVWHITKYDASGWNKIKFTKKWLRGLRWIKRLQILDDPLWLSEPMENHLKKYEQTGSV